MASSTWARRRSDPCAAACARASVQSIGGLRALAAIGKDIAADGEHLDQPGQTAQRAFGCDRLAEQPVGCSPITGALRDKCARRKQPPLCQAVVDRRGPRAGLCQELLRAADVPQLEHDLAEPNRIDRRQRHAALCVSEPRFEAFGRARQIALTDCHLAELEQRYRHRRLHHRLPRRGRGSAWPTPRKTTYAPSLYASAAAQPIAPRSERGMG